MKEEIWDGEMDYGWEDLAELYVIILQMLCLKPCHFHQ